MQPDVASSISLWWRMQTHLQLSVGAAASDLMKAGSVMESLDHKMM